MGRLRFGIGEIWLDAFKVRIQVGDLGILIIGVMPMAGGSAATGVISCRPMLIEGVLGCTYARLFCQYAGVIGSAEKIGLA